MNSQEILKKIRLMNKGYLYAFLTALCWSTSGLFVKFIHQSAFVISGTTALIALIINHFYYRKPLKWNCFAFLVGVCQFMMHITFTFANQYTSVGNAIILQYSSMIFVLIYESVDKKRLPKLYQLIVIIIAALGMTIFFWDGFASNNLLGNILAIISGAFFGLQFYLNTKPQAIPVTSIKIQYLLSILSMVVYLFYARNFSISLTDTMFLGFSGVIQTALAGILFAQCIVRISAFSANIICMSEIFLAPLWALIFLGERFSFGACIGSILMIIALTTNIIIDYRSKQLKKER